MNASAATHALRGEVREWLAAHVPAGWRAQMTGATQAQFLGFQRAWMLELVSAGFATSHWTARWPGGGRPLEEQIVIAEELARADAPRLTLYFVSLFHAALTLMEWGTPEQQARHLPAILAGEIWCQGFSEPNAGSDLASLKTHASRSGDHYIVNGQKIWSTLAQHADHCLLLVRTNGSGPRQAGITYLLMDMRSPGVVCRPIRQMTGDEEFAEVFLQDVKIPVANRLGAENEGWRIAQTTLNSERGLTILELSERLFHARWRLLDVIGERDGRVADDQLRREAVDVFIRIDVLRAQVNEMMAVARAGADIGGRASFVKLQYARVLREFTRLGERAAADSHLRQPFTLGGGYETGHWSFDFMNSYQWSIAGGSNEIQRNIVAERVLGMPREKTASA